MPFNFDLSFILEECLEIVCLHSLVRHGIYGKRDRKLRRNTTYYKGEVMRVDWELEEAAIDVDYLKLKKVKDLAIEYAVVNSYRDKAIDI